jgi:hypothetical protein
MPYPYNMKEREYQFLKTIPEALMYKTLLYIGANPGRQQMLNLFLEKNYYIMIKEAWQKNCDELITMNKNKKIYDELWTGDARYMDPYMQDTDITLWWHGPEHINKNELDFTLYNIESKTNKMVILGCPWGTNKQDAIDGNEFEIHRSTLYPEDFKLFGYQTITLGEKDVPGSNILSWKKLTYK